MVGDVAESVVSTAGVGFEAGTGVSGGADMAAAERAASTNALRNSFSVTLSAQTDRAACMQASLTVRTTSVSWGFTTECTRRDP